MSWRDWWSGAATGYFIAWALAIGTHHIWLPFFAKCYKSFCLIMK